MHDYSHQVCPRVSQYGFNKLLMTLTVKMLYEVGEKNYFRKGLILTLPFQEKISSFLCYTFNL